MTTDAPRIDPASSVPPWIMLPLLTTIASLAVVAATLGVNGAGEEGVRLATRYTVRVSFPLFLIAYTASPMMRLRPSRPALWAVRNRRYLGVSFAIAHFIHLALIVAYFTMIGEIPDTVTIVLGGLAYVFIAAMAATSNDWSVRKLGGAWKTLHLVGIHYVWFIFAATYARRIGDPDMVWVGVIGTGIALVALAVRALAFLTKRQRA